MNTKTTPRAGALKDVEYLGDGVYAGHDGFNIWLVTKVDGTWHEVALDPSVAISFKAYEQALTLKYAKGQP